jgi:hypothetical protein
MTPAEIDQYANLFLYGTALVALAYFLWKMAKPKPVITEKKVPQRPLGTAVKMQRSDPVDDITDYHEVPKNHEMKRPTLKMPQRSGYRGKAYSAGSPQKRYDTPDVVFVENNDRCESPRSDDRDDRSSNDDD